MGFEDLACSLLKVGQIGLFITTIEHKKGIRIINAFQKI